MRVFVIGSSITESQKEKFNSFSRKIGQLLGESPHQIILCSAHKSSLDYFILEGLSTTSAAKEAKKIIVHRPEDLEIKKDWMALIERLKIKPPAFTPHSGPKFRSENNEINKEGLRLAFLLCQIKAIEEADIIITIGGNINGASALLLPIAEHKGKIILPFRFFGGVAENFFYKLESDIISRHGHTAIEKLSSYCDPDNDLLEIIDNVKNIKASENTRIFLSYAWKQSSIADMVEALLRRRTNVTIFRDENDIELGANIDEKIFTEIKYKCHVFIALWSIEYIESPYCHDEVNLWLEHRNANDLFLLRLDKSRPVWPILRKSPDNRKEFQQNWPLVEECRKNIESALDKILANRI